MQASTRRGISYPVASRTDAPDIPLHITNLINAIDLDTPLYTGTEAAKPAANTRVQGSWYYATDSGLLYFNSGAAWVSMAFLASPAFSGNPTAPNQANTDNSTRLATTAFVRSIVPPGLGPLPWPTAVPPSGWLLCDGSAVSRTTYAALYAVISTMYGVGDGSTTFNLPDCRGRIPVGQKATGAFTTLGGVGGEESHVLITAEMPGHVHTGTTDSENATHTHSGNTGGRSAAHTHAGTTDMGGPSGATILSYSTLDVTTGGASARVNSITEGGTTHAHTFTTGTESSDHSHAFTSGTQSANHQHTFTTGSTGGGGAHNNIQPYIVVNYIIKT